MNPLGYMGYFPVLLPEVDKGDEENLVAYSCFMIKTLIEGNN